MIIISPIKKMYLVLPIFQTLCQALEIQILTGVEGLCIYACWEGTNKPIIEEYDLHKEHIHQKASPSWFGWGWVGCKKQRGKEAKRRGEVRQAESTLGRWAVRAKARHVNEHVQSLAQNLQIAGTSCWSKGETSPRLGLWNSKIAEC